MEKVELQAEALELLRAMQTDEDPRFVANFLTCALEFMKLTLAKLRASSGACDLSEIAALAHSLNNSSLNIGARELSEVCQKLESAARTGKDPAFIQALRQSLEVRFREAETALHELPEMNSR